MEIPPFIIDTKFKDVLKIIHDYWINGCTHKKQKGPLTKLTKQEEEEVVVWWKDMAQLGNGLELIQVKFIVGQMC